MKKLYLVLIIGLLTHLFCATYTVDGNAFLEGETDHSGIEVKFQRIAPDTLFNYTTYTNSAGYYSQAVESGWYESYYDKAGFSPDTLTTINAYSDNTLDDVTLLGDTTLSGGVSGILDGEFEVSGDLTVADGDTLTIMPGTILKFHTGTEFIINGTLHAYGAENDSIKFTSMPGSDWFGVYLYSTDHTAYFTYCIINNSIRRGIYSQASRMNLSNTHVYNNYSVYDVGAGIFTTGNTTITDCIIEDNEFNHGSSTTDSGGGGITFSGSGNILTNSIIKNNISSRGGGGITLEAASSDATEIRHCIIEGNQGYKGGGIYTISGGTISDCIIQNNQSTYGGGIYHKGWYLMTYCNLVVSGNSAGANLGGGVYFYSGNSHKFMNCVIIGNTGSGFVCQSSGLSPDIQYCNLWNNTGSDFYNCNQFLGMMVQSNANGDSCDSWYNISMDPLFIDDTYRPSSNSPCIDSGINPISGYTFPDYDMDGNTRIMDGTGNEIAVVDMGVFEYKIPEQPQNLITTIIGNNVQLNWDPLQGIDTFKVYSSTDPFAEFPSGWTEEVNGLSVTDWTDTNVAEAKKFYVVVGVNGQ